MHCLKVKAPKRLTPCTIELPPSKSIANRMLILSALCGIRPNDVLHCSFTDLCDDIRVLAELLSTDTPQVSVGAAGTAMRFGTAYLAVSTGERIITGTPRLQQRPIGILVDALRTLGADIAYIGNEGYPPLRIKGNTSMKGGELRLQGNISSQFISALLMIAPTLSNGLSLHLMGDIVSRPYIDITIQLMQQFGVDIRWTDERTIVVGNKRMQASNKLTIEADWTAASYWYEIIMLSDNATDETIRLAGLNTNSMQGDCVCHDIFSLLRQQTGCNKQADTPFKYDFTRCPDLAQTIVVTCCMKDIPFHFTGLQTLRIKETDRIAALQTELRKLGYVLETTDNSISWNGTTVNPQPNAVIHTYDDHRMAMAFAPCALKFGELTIADPQVVNKSYPTYWKHLEQIGMELCLSED